MKKIGRMLLLFTMFFILTGCGRSDESRTTSAAVQNQSDEVQQQKRPAKEAEQIMNILIGDTTYRVQLDDNETTRDIVENMPFDLSMVKYAGHEYYAELPFTPSFDQTRTSEVKAGHLYYWDGWNAFVINYVDYDIAPYKVVHIGEIKDAEISSYLQNTDENITIKVTE